MDQSQKINLLKTEATTSSNSAMEKENKNLREKINGLEKENKNLREKINGNTQKILRKIKQITHDDPDWDDPDDYYYFESGESEEEVQETVIELIDFLKEKDVERYKKQKVIDELDELINGLLYEYRNHSPVERKKYTQLGLFY